VNGQLDNVNPKQNGTIHETTRINNENVVSDTYFLAPHAGSPRGVHHTARFLTSVPVGYNGRSHSRTHQETLQ
jgi:hypothetical protein